MIFFDVSIIFLCPIHFFLPPLFVSVSACFHNFWVRFGKVGLDYREREWGGEEGKDGRREAGVWVNMGVCAIEAPLEFARPNSTSP